MSSVYLVIFVALSSNIIIHTIRIYIFFLKERQNFCKYSPVMDVRRRKGDFLLTHADFFTLKVGGLTAAQGGQIGRPAGPGT